MNEMQKAAYVMSQAAAALIEAMGMAADNQQREYRGEAVAYSKQAFDDLITNYGIHHNEVMGTLQD